MATEIQFAGKPVKRPARLEQVLMRILPPASQTAANPDLHLEFEQWQQRWEVQLDQINRRLNLLDQVLQEDTIAEGAE